MPTDAGFVCDKAAMLGDVMKEPMLKWVVWDSGYQEVPEMGLLVS